MRAIATPLVIVDHSLLEITHNAPGSAFTHAAWILGSTGLYIFFVISGFIMVRISWDNFGQRASAREFIRRRIIRIVPLYWLATMAALAFHRISMTHGAHASWSDLVQSLLFVPYRGPDGGWAPILPQGWTLNYEMMFYGVFAVGIVFPRHIALATVGMMLGMLTVISSFLTNGIVRYLASPIVLWFC
jgi:exopolysaccharide production protein ExoZ